MTALFALGISSLFLELLLIRFLSTEVYMLSILPNILLIACFLGLGLGSWTSRDRASVRRVLLVLCALLLCYCVPWARALLDRGGHLAHLVFVVALFVPFGRILGRLLQDTPNTVRAYSANVLGSLCGIWAFAALGVVSQPPVVWLGVGVVLLLWLAWCLRESLVINGLLGVAAMLLMGYQQHNPAVLAQVWSPYQKVTLAWPQPGANDGLGHIGKYVVTINCRVSYQGLLDLRPENVAAHPGMYPPEGAGLSQYDLPAQFHPKPERTLVVGAGTGNDVAGLLRNGAGHVTAVDIDPAIIELGRQFHPERPYDDAKVTVVADDARSFLANSQEKFDLIVFGLLDSHAALSGSSHRLDAYVYTLQSFQQARRLLAPGGVLVVAFEPGFGDHIIERLMLTLRQVFGQDIAYFRVPASNYGWGGVLFVASDDPRAVVAQIKSRPRLLEALKNWGRDFTIYQGRVLQPATDDWPYLYLETPQIPPFYTVLWGMPLLMLLAVGPRRSWSLVRHWKGENTHFALLGAAFLLLETQNVSRTCVLFGNTWWINAVVITGVMILILVANLVAARHPRLPLLPVYGGLIGACLLLYVVGLTPFATWPPAVRALGVGLFVSLPMFFSGIVFIRSLEGVEDRDHALAANLLGSMVGGALQCLTFLLGFRALLLIVGGLYAAAWFFRPRGR